MTPLQVRAEGASEAEECGRACEKSGERGVSVGPLSLSLQTFARLTPLADGAQRGSNWAFAAHALYPPT